MASTAYDTELWLSLKPSVQKIGSQVAAAHADDVDKSARFPSESLSALKEAKVLGAYVPKELGGLGCGLIELAAMCEVLGQHCSATAMVLAMHHIQVACLV